MDESRHIEPVQSREIETMSDLRTQPDDDHRPEIFVFDGWGLEPLVLDEAR